MPRKTASPPTDLTGYRLPPVYERVVCERDDVNEGLTRPLEITVLVNPSRVEIFALSRQITEHFAAVGARYERRRAERERAVAAGEEPPPVFDRDQDLADERALIDIIAPRVTAWNVEALNGDGAKVDLPPPAELGGIVADLLSNAQRRWLIDIVTSAHHGGDARSKLSRRPAATASTEGAKTPSGPQIVDIPTGESRPDRRKSS